MRKCPVCNSTQLELENNKVYCKKCGYINKKYDILTYNWNDEETEKKLQPIS